jgi:hypothetical protein
MVCQTRYAIMRNERYTRSGRLELLEGYIRGFDPVEKQHRRQINVCGLIVFAIVKPSDIRKAE